MKNTKLVLLFLPFVVLLTACPIGLEYPADEEGKNPIEKKLTGTWNSTSADHEVMKVKIEKKDNTSYKVTVLEKGSMYSEDDMEFTGWVTKIDDINIIYFKSANSNYYHYCYKIKDKNSFYTYDISLKVGGTDAVTSTQALRDEIKASSKMEDFLTSETLFTKE